MTLLDSRASTGGIFRGEALMPSGLGALEQLGLLPLPAAVRQRPLEGWSVWLNSRPLFAADEPMGCPHPCTLVSPDDLLVGWSQALERRPSAQLRLGTAVAAPIEQHGRITGVRLSDGTELVADLVIACDGRHSPLRRAAGLDLEQEPTEIDVLWFRLNGPEADALKERLADRFHTLIGSEGSMALFTSASGGIQLGWPVTRGERCALTPEQWRQRWLSLCPPAMAQALASLPTEAIEGPQRLPVRVGLARQWWRPGLLLLGDAAHPMSPIRAQGTSMALRDVLAASTLLPTALLQTDAPTRAAAVDQALETLEALRRPEIRRIQTLQRQEWQRGERLAHNGAVRQLLTCLAPGLGPLLAAFWIHSQRELRLGLADAGPAGPS